MLGIDMVPSAVSSYGTCSQTNELALLDPVPPYWLGAATKILFCATLFCLLWALGGNLADRLAASVLSWMPDHDEYAGVRRARTYRRSVGTQVFPRLRKHAGCQAAPASTGQSAQTEGEARAATQETSTQTKSATQTKSEVQKATTTTQTTTQTTTIPKYTIMTSDDWGEEIISQCAFLPRRPVIQRVERMSNGLCSSSSDHDTVHCSSDHETISSRLSVHRLAAQLRRKQQQGVAPASLSLSAALPLSLSTVQPAATPAQSMMPLRPPPVVAHSLSPLVAGQ